MKSNQFTNNALHNSIFGTIFVRTLQHQLQKQLPRVHNCKLNRDSPLLLIVSVSMFTNVDLYSYKKSLIHIFESLITYR